MQFTTSATLALLGLAGSSMAAPAKGNSSSIALNIITTSADLRIQLAAINSTDFGFFIGSDNTKPVSTSCPASDAAQVGFDCSKTQAYTSLVAHPDQLTVGLNVAVEGGQGLYVGDGGAVRYLGARRPLPVGSQTNFTFTPGDTASTVGRINGPNGATFVACPTLGDQKVYQMFDSKNRAFAQPLETCITMGFGAIASTNQTVAAYEYN